MAVTLMAPFTLRHFFLEDESGAFACVENHITQSIKDDQLRKCLREELSSVRGQRFSQPPTLPFFALDFVAHESRNILSHTLKHHREIDTFDALNHLISAEVGVAFPGACTLVT